MNNQEDTIEAGYFEIRSFAYDVLRHFFMQEPNKELLKLLKDSELQDFPFVNENAFVSEGVKEVTDFFNQYKIDEVFERLHWDYTRMFIGPYELPAPLWESVYLNEERLLFQKETLVVRQAYLKYNFLPENFGSEADDHLGLELDFLYQLNQLTIESVQQGDITRTNEIILDQIDFLENHLLKWVPLLRKKIIEHASFDFYIGMIKILQGFLETDKNCLEELMFVKQ